MVDLRRLDLNLLKVFAILMEERSVGRTAGRLGVTPSAVSHSLARLRRDLGDALFVRAGSTMIPTARALHLEQSILGLIRTLASELAAPGAGASPFDPAQTHRTLRIAAPGALEPTLVAALATLLRDRAPTWTLAVKSFERRSYQVDLTSGRLDFVCSIGGHTPAGVEIRSDVLWEDELVAVVGPKSPLWAGPSVVPVELYLDQPQAYPLSWSPSQNYLDIELARHGRHRQLALSLPSYAGLGDVLEATDLIASMPDRTAAVLMRHHPSLRLLRVLPARRSNPDLLWTLTGQRDPALAWTRTAILEAAATLQRGVPNVD